MTSPSKQGKILIEKSKVEALRKLNAKQHQLLKDMNDKLHWIRSSLVEVFNQVNFFINPKDGGEPDVDGLREFVVKCTSPVPEADDGDDGAGEGEDEGDSGRGEVHSDGAEESGDESSGEGEEGESDT